MSKSHGLVYMKTFFLIIFLFVSLAEVVGQGRADRLFERGDYLGALKLYQKDLEGDKANDDKLKARVANCFFHLNDVVRAGQMYKSLNQDILGAEDMLFYATTLQRSGEYDKALKLLNVVEEMGGDMEAVDRLRASCEFATKMAKEKPVYAANKTNINFAGFSSGVTYYKGKGIIIAAPGTGEAADSRGYKLTRLYQAIFSEDGKGGKMLPFGDGLVDKYHIGAVTFTKDFKRIYYTKTILKKDGTSILKLLTAEDVDGEWKNIKELNINSDDYSCAHPALYRDSLLFFVSDMPGGMGGKDIYMTTVNEEVCDDVINLGETVNTPDDELFPFIDADGNLYFASNGHVGLGGLDVFVTRMNARGIWSEPQNMGRPVNSSMDDFGLVFKDTKCKEGFVSTNRGGTGYQDFLFSLKALPNREMKNAPEPEKEVAPVVPVVPKQDMFTVDYRYAIQVGAFRNPVPRVYFENFSNVKVYLGFDNVYRYTVGEYPEEGIAAMDLAQVQKTIHDAFVVNVDTYVKQRKIQNDVKGDNISDDELLLIRLKNFEQMKKKPSVTAPSSRTAPKRYLDKPREGEMSLIEGYTVVLMSADNVLDNSAFEGIDNVDVYAVGEGEYMYCSGLYDDPALARQQLNRVRQKGFAGAYIIRTGTDNSEYSESTRPASRPQESPARRDELKKLLNF